ncbi:MAG: hypothetical protein GEV09_09920 [Pseudonocardiaceae bacterium]|nr:hypothetical protein [Pseudonocardiaceae bacterium]
MMVSRNPVAVELAALGELVGQQVRRAVAAVRDPRAKALRRRRRARRALVLRSGAAAVAAAVTAVIGEAPGLEFGEIATGSVAGFALLGSGAAGVRLMQLRRTPLPEAPTPPAPAPPLPPRGSAVRRPLQRLAAAEASLADLLAVLARPRPGGPLLAAEGVRATREAAAGAIASLRRTAESAVAVERALAGAPAGEREALSQGVDGLHRQLEEGTDDVSALVAAAGRAVAAGEAEVPWAELTDATDRLAGLAAALRELARTS